MATMHSTNLFLLILLITLLLKFSISDPQPWLEELLYRISSDRITIERNAIENASTDFGKLGQTHPAAVLFPESTSDIEDLVRFSYESFSPFPVSAKGRAHSIHGQAQAQKGVVIEMMSLFNGEHRRIGKKYGRVNCINVEKGIGSKEVCYVDVSGGQLWIDVLLESLKHDYAPVSWTDYLYLTVGGTLSNAGVSGQAFLHGPQINNVLEMDVITGKGEMFTCSRTENAELFYAVLGGLGQFGIITRARIHEEKAPHMVKWARLAYSNFTDFTKDQEYLISLNGEMKKGGEGFDYVEGFVMMGDDNGCSGTGSSKWRSTSFTFAHQHEHNNDSIFYCLEVCKYYTNSTQKHAEEVVGNLLSNLHHMPGMVSQRDVGYVEFLDRVHKGELQLRSVGMWDVPHPWLCLFVPRSRILEFHDVVFRGIVAANNTNNPGPILLYPTNTNTWDPRMSAALPTEEDVFYAVNLLRTAVKDWGFYEDQNRAIVTACEERNIDCKMYLPHYTQEKEWKKHFGERWTTLLKRKAEFDPRGILATGQKIFRFPLDLHLGTN